MSDQNSLPEVFSTIKIPFKGSFIKKLFAFSGPGLLVAVGYMDPGNWATSLAGGSQFGFSLLSVILLSNVFAILLQYLALKLGIASEKDLAQQCRAYFSPSINFILWLLCEIAIAACDLAEVLGSAIALNLLFHIPLMVGVLITSLDVLVILFFQKKGFRILESIVAGLIFVVFIAFVYELLVSHPDIFPMLKGFIPTKEVYENPSMLYIAIGILGATVMPHNLYLHSSIVQTRDYPRTIPGKKMAIKFATIDSTMSLFFAFFINAAILIVSAASFYTSGHRNVSDLTNAYQLLSPVLGVSLASAFFAIALLASGQNATITGTLAGQIVMEGFLSFKLKPWQRRLVTRLIAILPACIIISLRGAGGMTDLLLFSQIILSIQLSFAVIPLVLFTSNKKIMGLFVNSWRVKVISWFVASVILFFNLLLFYQFCRLK